MRTRIGSCAANATWMYSAKGFLRREISESGIGGNAPCVFSHLCRDPLLTVRGGVATNPRTKMKVILFLRDNDNDAGVRALAKIAIQKRMKRRRAYAW